MDYFVWFTFSTCEPCGNVPLDWLYLRIQQTHQNLPGFMCLIGCQCRCHSLRTGRTCVCVFVCVLKCSLLCGCIFSEVIWLMYQIVGALHYTMHLRNHCTRWRSDNVDEADWIIMHVHIFVLYISVCMSRVPIARTNKWATHMVVWVCEHPYDHFGMHVWAWFVLSRWCWAYRRLTYTNIYLY